MLEKKYDGNLTYFKDIPVGSSFHVHNGNWDGCIIEEDGIKKVYVYETGRAFSIPEDLYGWLSIYTKEND